MIQRDDKTSDSLTEHSLNNQRSRHHDIEHKEEITLIRDYLLRKEKIKLFRKFTHFMQGNTLRRELYLMSKQNNKELIKVS